MKKLLAVSAIAALGLSGVAVAGGLPEPMPMAPMATTSESGIYVGAQGGWGITHWKDVNSDDDSSIDNDNGFVARGFLGFDINRYFALEAGYTYFFNRAKIKSGSTESFKIDTSAIDLMFKGKLPVVDNFDLYAKLGASYLMSNVKKSFDGNDPTGLDGKHNNFNVAYGAGADYYITPNVIANVEWLRFNGNLKQDVKHYQPYTDAFLLGLRYKFDL